MWWIWITDSAQVAVVAAQHHRPPSIVALVQKIGKEIDSNDPPSLSPFSLSLSLSGYITIMVSYLFVYSFSFRLLFFYFYPYTFLVPFDSPYPR